MKSRKYANSIIKILKEQPIYAILVVILWTSVFMYVLTVLEINPEFETRRWQREKALQQGDTILWLGMELAPITRSIRHEFKLPRKVKGVFVVNEGIGLAKQRGILTGDIITSINREKVINHRSFVGVANSTQYFDGIMIEIFRNKKKSFVTIPFNYEYGPAFGPNKGHWELGAPVIKQLIPYGPLTPTGP